MHPLRPLKSLFHPAIILSIIGQAAIHIACMTLAVNWATEQMGPEVLNEVTEFFRKAKAKEIDLYEHCDEDDMMCQMTAFWTAPFLPNLLNSVVSIYLFIYLFFLFCFILFCIILCYFVL
jgi:cation-transporting ATPase 13A1